MQKQSNPSAACSGILRRGVKSSRIRGAYMKKQSARERLFIFRTTRAPICLMNVMNVMNVMHRP
jgi:hypothetical protein